MMHHPNMHHQPMSGHPPQHMPGHQAMPAHHQMPPHQLHRETRVPLGPSQAGGGMGPGQPLGGMGGMGVPHHGPPHRPPHAIRAMPHHPQPPHLSVPPQAMKAMRRPYGYNPSGVVRAPYPQPHLPPPPPAALPPPHTSSTASNVNGSTPSSNAQPAGLGAAAGDSAAVVASSSNSVNGGGDGGGASGAAAEGAGGDGEAANPPAQANSKEKTPMCLVNELARYNKIKHQYRLTSETGPAHKKIFTVTLRLGDTEEYTAEGSSIKRAQHAAAGAALAGTRYPPPPPRAPPPHHHHAHHRHSGAVMPTVELNALAMKLCQPAVYTSLPPTMAGGGRGMRGALRGSRGGFRAYGPGPFGRLDAPELVYRVRVSVGGRAWLGAGDTPQAARHDAAARALHELRPMHPAASPNSAHDRDPPSSTLTDAGAAQPPANGTETSPDLLNSDVKSPVSLVHELALKRNFAVHFAVKSERGPPHMRVFITSCTVGDMETEGEGNGKKVSKRRAAESMLAEMRRRWPAALLRPRPPPHDPRRANTAKKKPRNLIKEGETGRAEVEGGPENPISRLAQARHGARARSPQYSVLEERGAARRREFLVQCDAPPHSATGVGPNKKTAKRRAAHNVLLAMQMAGELPDINSSANANADTKANGTTEQNKTTKSEPKRKEGSNGGGVPEVRQPVPGVLLMDYHSRAAHPAQPAHSALPALPAPPAHPVQPVQPGLSPQTQHNAGVNGSEICATGGSGGNTPGCKDQLMYLSQLLGFTVQFSDFPKRNHGEYLSLVSLSTEPPVMCHGGGPSTAHSHEQCARAALRALALMGLDAPGTTSTTSTTNTSLSIVSLPGSGSSTSSISNCITE